MDGTQTDTILQTVLKFPVGHACFQGGGVQILAGKWNKRKKKEERKNRASAVTMWCLCDYMSDIAVSSHQICAKIP